MRLAEIPYRRDSAVLFERIAGQPWSVFVDSGYPLLDRGRYDILSCTPAVTLRCYGDDSLVVDTAGARRSREDPLLLLRRALGEVQHDHYELPFCGGALGYVAYDQGAGSHLPAQPPMPQLAVGIYDWAVVVDHQLRRAWLVGQGRDEGTERRWPHLLQLFSAPDKAVAATPAMQFGSVQANMSELDYRRAFRRVQHYIHEGDCYQVNLAVRFHLGFSGDPWPLYRHLRSLNPAPFAAFMRLPEGAVLSHSPERFLKVHGGKVETCPIKGTRPRGAHPLEDLARAEELIESAKDRAENLMIVDLLRNDLGKVCRAGSISVPRLFALESFATVHHLVSTITGELDTGRHSLELLRGCFPGGSITGAPKLRAMEIIDELEPHRRSVYCGCFLRLGYDGNMDSSITIRTLVHDGGRLYLWAGGGIVADSTAEQEYAELHDKAQVFLRLFRRGAGATLRHLSAVSSVRP